MRSRGLLTGHLAGWATAFVLAFVTAPAGAFGQPPGGGAGELPTDEQGLIAQIKQLDEDPAPTWSMTPRAHQEMVVTRRTRQVEVADRLLSLHPQTSFRNDAIASKLTAMFIIVQLTGGSVDALSQAVDTILAAEPDKELAAIAGFFRFHCASVQKMQAGVPIDELASWQRDFLAQYVKDYPDGKFSAEALYTVVVLCWQAGLNKEGLEFFDTLKAKHPTNGLTRELSVEAPRRRALGRPFEMKFTAVDGREIDIAKMRGKVVLVEFWATWCGPCLISLPEVIDVHKRYHTKGFEVVGINLDYRRQELDQFAKARGITWPNFFDGRGWNSSIVARYGVAGIPASFLVDKEGRLRALEVRGNLEAEVKKLLAE